MKELFHRGQVLAGPALAAAPTYTGSLVISDWTDEATKRATRRAVLHELTNATVRPGLLPPLFDPVLVKMTDAQMTLQGYVIGSEKVGDEYRSTRYYQVWVLVALESPSLHPV